MLLFLPLSLLCRFQSLPARDKVVCSAIDNAEFLDAFLELVRRPHEGWSFHLPSRRGFREREAVEDTFFGFLVGELRVAWVGEPQLYLSNA